MNIEESKKIVKATDDLRLLVKEDGKIRIYDLFLNGDGILALESYALISKDDLEEVAKEENSVINGDTIDTLLSRIKMWHTNENETEGFEFLLNDFFENFDITKIIGLPKLPFNETVIEFMDKDLDEILYSCI